MVKAEGCVSMHGGGAVSEMLNKRMIFEVTDTIKHIPSRMHSKYRRNGAKKVQK
jgi:hypothetical protein